MCMASNIKIKKETKGDQMSREILKQARKDKGMTQQAMAEYLNIGLGYYKQLESGSRTGNVELWDTMEDLFNVHQRVLRQAQFGKSEEANQ